MSSLLRLACHARLGLAGWRDVERVGLEELANGSSESEIVALAAVTASTDRIGEMVADAVTAKGGRMPDDAAAAEIVAGEVAAQILSGSVEPVSGARSIWDLARRVPTVEPQLRVFIGLASEWDDDVPNRLAYEADIVAAARAFVARVG